jgi:hypothetical protein
VVRGIYSDALSEWLRRERGGLGIDTELLTIPRFGAQRYAAMEPERLAAEYAQRVDAAPNNRRSCSLAAHKPAGGRATTRLPMEIALAKDDCEAWMRAVYHDVCSNPEPSKVWSYRLLGGAPKTGWYGHCNHMFTLLLDWEQVQSYLISPASWLNSQAPRRYLQRPPAPPPAGKGAPAGGAAALAEGGPDGLNAADRARGQAVAAFTVAAAEAAMKGENRFEAAANPAWDMIRSRLDLPFHQALTDVSVMNTLTYLWHHMKCGVYVKIRGGRLEMFVPFCNLRYRNSWSEEFEKTALPPKGQQGSADDPLGLRAYYGEKVAVSGKREEEVDADSFMWHPWRGDLDWKSPMSRARFCLASH